MDFAKIDLTFRKEYDGAIHYIIENGRISESTNEESSSSSLRSDIRRMKDELKNLAIRNRELELLKELKQKYEG